MKEKKTNIILIIAIVVATIILVVFGTLAGMGVFREFDAEGYVSAMLDQTLKGEVKAATKMTDGTTEESLYAQYEEGIKSFVSQSLIRGAEVSGEIETKYIEVSKKIFASMKYEVHEAEKVKKGEFRVEVSYQPVNIFQTFIDSVEAESKRLNEKVEKGEYRGTIDEINAQMKEEFLSNSCKLFEEAYNTMEFGEKKTVVFTVVKGDDGLYELENAQIAQFLKKILGIDEIQD